MNEYRVKIWGEEHIMSGDFAQASSPIFWDGDSTQYQVADFRHRPQLALLALLEQYALATGGTDDSVRAEIERAIEQALDDAGEYIWAGDDAYA